MKSFMHHLYQRLSSVHLMLGAVLESGPLSLVSIPSIIMRRTNRVSADESPECEVSLQVKLTELVRNVILPGHWR